VELVVELVLFDMSAEVNWALACAKSKKLKTENRKKHNYFSCNLIGQ
jgi:hypothetical protein